MSAPNVCEKCGKEYYSDTEYEQHVFMHQQTELLEKAAESNREFGTKLSTYLSQLSGNLSQLAYLIETATITQIVFSKQISYEEATNEYLQGITVVQRIVGARNQVNEHRKKVATAGYFDPIHPGHRSHFQAARALGDKLAVIIHPDEFCIKKKGFCYMKLADRVRDLLADVNVDEVVVSIDGDGTVARTLKMVKPQIFARGGDRSPDQHPIPQAELDACAEIGCTIVYNVGEPKRPGWSSTEIGKKALGLQ